MTTEMMNNELSMDELNDVNGGCIKWSGKCIRLGLFHGIQDAKDGVDDIDWLKGETTGPLYRLGYTGTKLKKASSR